MIFWFDSMRRVWAFALIVTALSAITGISLPPPQVWPLLGLVGGVLARRGGAR